MAPCERYKQALLDAVDQDDATSLRSDIQEHLRQCEACRQFYANLMRLKQGLKKLRPVKAPDSFQVVLRERIRREAAHKPGLRFLNRPRFSTPAVLGMTAAAVILMLVLGRVTRPFGDGAELQVRPAEAATGTSRVLYVIDDLDAPGDRTAAQRTSRIDSLLELRNDPDLQLTVRPVSF